MAGRATTSSYLEWITNDRLVVPVKAWRCLVMARTLPYYALVIIEQQQLLPYSVTSTKVLGAVFA